MSCHTESLIGFTELFAVLHFESDVNGSIRIEGSGSSLEVIGRDTAREVLVELIDLVDGQRQESQNDVLVFFRDRETIQVVDHFDDSEAALEPVTADVEQQFAGSNSFHVFRIQVHTDNHDILAGFLTSVLQRGHNTGRGTAVGSPDALDLRMSLVQVFHGILGFIADEVTVHTANDHNIIGFGKRAVEALFAVVQGGGLIARVGVPCTRRGRNQRVQSAAVRAGTASFRSATRP